MLMDLFYSTLPPQFRGPPPHHTSNTREAVEKVSKYGSTRIHFHAFMLDVLQRQHEVQAAFIEQGVGPRDVTPEVARQLASEGRVLCFDEFQVGCCCCLVRRSSVLSAQVNPVGLCERNGT